MRQIKFIKSQGAGNDFVIIDELDSSYNLGPEEIKKICDRHYGVGADGVLIAKHSTEADFRMVFFNPDGTEAEMCGNGIRCFGKYLYDHGRTSKNELIIDTKSGIKVLTLNMFHGEVVSANVDMGKPNFIAKMIPIEAPIEEFVDMPVNVNGNEFSATCLSMGNPHCVLFVEDLNSFPVSEVGPQIELLPIFPERTNVEFAQVKSRKLISLKVWERGAGLTLACGTGACASVVAAVKRGLTDRNVQVELPGGILNIQWAESDSVYLSGPAEEVFSGTIKL